jgi:GTPase SAR1 family protein
MWSLAKSSCSANQVNNLLKPGVGKTSIIGRYVHNTFNSTSNPTLGASFAAKNVNFTEYDKNIKFEVKPKL